MLEESTDALTDQAQAIVNAVAQDTQTIADESVRQLSEMLAANDQRTTEGTVVLDDGQYGALMQELRLSTTLGLIGALASMAVFGAVCAGYLVQGWRRD